MTPYWLGHKRRHLIAAFAITWWRRHRCHHLDWSPLDGCPSCGKV